jgi:uncharacterized membrane protein
MLISAESTTTLWSVVIAIVAFGMWAEQKTKFGKVLTGIVVAMLTAMLLSNLRVIPANAPVYDSIFRDLLPIAIPLLLFRADLRNIFREGGATLLAFAIGAVGVILGIAVATFFVQLGDLRALAAGLFSATYIGGSANFSAVAIAADFNDGTVLTSMIAADVIVTNFQTMLLIALPGFAIVRRYLPVGSPVGASPAGSNDFPFTLRDLNLVGLAFALSLAFVLVSAGNFIAGLVGNPSLGIVVTSALALLVANFARPLVQKMSGEYMAALFLIFLFLVAVAASADIWVLAETGPVYFIFAGIILAVHTAFILVMARFIKLDLRAVIIGSTACVGGVTSASAIASAKGWRDLVVPGILAGTVGNAVGTFIGVWLWMMLS